MSVLSKAAEVALEVILAALRGLPAAQKARVLDAARERLAFDAAGQAKLDARRKGRP